MIKALLLLGRREHRSPKFLAHPPTPHGASWLLATKCVLILVATFLLCPASQGLGRTSAEITRLAQDYPSELRGKGQLPPSGL